LGIGAEALNKAELRLQTLRDEAEKRREAEDEMSRAEKAEDIEALVTSIKRAEEVGVSQNVVLLMPENLAKRHRCGSCCLPTSWTTRCTFTTKYGLHFDWSHFRFRNETCK